MSNGPGLRNVPRVHIGRGRSRALRIVYRSSETKVQLFLCCAVFRGRKVILQRRGMRGCKGRAIFLRGVRDVSLRLPTRRCRLVALCKARTGRTGVRHFPVRCKIRGARDIEKDDDPRRRPFFTTLGPRAGRYDKSI